MAKKTENQIIIENDTFRYKKNKLASTLTLLGLVFNCLYFMLLYSFNHEFFYKLVMGISVIVTLILLLTAFLSSEGIKNYRKVYCIVLIILAAFNIARIFYFPMQGFKAGALERDYFGIELTNSASLTLLIIYLVASSACYVGACVVGFLRAVRLEQYMKKIESGEVSIEAVLKEEDEKDAVQVEVQPVENTGEVQ